MLLAAFFAGLEMALPFLNGLLPISPGQFAILVFFTTVAAIVSRFVFQKGLSDGT